MHLKHIKYFTIEIVKFLFNFDHLLCLHVFTALYIILSLLPLLLLRVIAELNESVLTIKKETSAITLNIKYQVNRTKDRWIQNQMRNTLINALNNNYR